MTTSNEIRDVMSSYWSEHSKQLSIEEMMLDEDATKLTKIEHPEVLSLLPSLEGKQVLELGAGIGRFTGDIAKTAKHVHAVDFMEAFIQKNKETNGSKYANTSFECADVMKLDMPLHSFDLIFSNWLLMYLSDEEIQVLMKKMLSWLSVGGYLFFRESCYHQSGNKKRGNNPTEYRTPMHYVELCESVEQEDDSNPGISYVFQAIFGRSIEAYITEKNNKNQYCWQWQKVTRDESQKYNQLQTFLDQNQYTINGIKRYEWIYGEGFVSSGGLPLVMQLCDKLNFKSGEKVLDIGSGIGAAAFYMAKTFDVFITGIDVSSNQINFAMEKANKEQNKKVNFEIGDVTHRNYKPNSFDVIYSKEVFLHIAEQRKLIESCFQWLKPGGRLLFTNYCSSEKVPLSARFQAYLNERQYHLVDIATERKFIEEAGFEKVCAEDTTAEFVKILENELAVFQKDRDLFLKDFSMEDYYTIVNGWADKLLRCSEGDLKTGEFFGVKRT